MGRGRTVLATSAGLVVTLVLLGITGYTGIQRIRGSIDGVALGTSRVEAYAGVQRALAAEAAAEAQLRAGATVAAEAAVDQALQEMALALGHARAVADPRDTAELDALAARQARYAESARRPAGTVQAEQLAGLQTVLDVVAGRAASSASAAASHQRALLGRMVWRAPIALLLTLLVIGMCWAVVVRLSRRAARLAAASEQLALQDTLTGVGNRLAFERALLPELARRVPDCAVLLLDLDGFKAINDTWGHETGDAVLTAVAERLQACVRETDLVARLGGDEFAILVRPAHQAEVLGLRLQAAVAEPLQVSGLVLNPGASLGLATMSPGCTRDDVLREADMCLYADKHRRRADGRRLGLVPVPKARDADVTPAATRPS